MIVTEFGMSQADCNQTDSITISKTLELDLYNVCQSPDDSIVENSTFFYTKAIVSIRSICRVKINETTLIVVSSGGC